MSSFQGKNKQLILFLASLVVAFGLGYGFRGEANASWWVEQYFGNATVPSDTVAQKADFAPFWEALSIVQNKYVGEVDYNRVVEGAIAGMVASVGDPYTVYIDQKGLKAFNEELNGTFEGIGAELALRDGQFIVVAPLEDSPAQHAGLLAGDSIIQVDGEDLTGKSLEETVSIIRGPGGTTVALTVIRKGYERPLTITITRGTINIKSVRYERNGEVGIITISRFDTATVDLVSEAYDQAQQEGARGLILDLRNNPGGYLDAAIGLVSLFVDDGVVVQEEYKGGARDQLRTVGRARDTQIPLVVLVNQGSASASEIVAGALKDYRRATIVGEKTFGKGSVQELAPMLRGGAVKVTIAKWLTPSGHALDQNGLDPDIMVEYKESDDLETDNQLDVALLQIQKLLQ